MKEITAAAEASGLSRLQMMENAGTAATQLLLEQLPNLKTVSLFCGSGNNGGDALVMARLLKQKGIHVLIVLANGKPTAPDAITNLYLATMLDIPIVFSYMLNEEDTEYIMACDAVVDGIYGAGCYGEMPIEAQVCCGIYNLCPGLKLALDVPSGVISDTGEVTQDSAKADITLAFHAKKPCHDIAKGNCGEVIIADIGINI